MADQPCSCIDKNCTTEALALALAVAYVQNQCLGRHGSPVYGVHCRTVPRKMGNGKEDQAPDHTFDISSNKYAFYHILAEGCLYFSPSKNQFFRAILPEQFKDVRARSMEAALFLYISCIHSTLIVYEGEIWQLKSYP